MKRSVTIALVYGLAGLALACSLGFLVAAAHGVLAGAYGSNTASVIMAGLFFVLAGAIAVVGLIMRWQQKRRRTMATTALVVAPAIAPAAIRALVSRPRLGAGIAAAVLAIGALAGARWAAGPADTEA